MEYLANPDVLGPSLPLIRLYYSGTGPMVGLLGAGVLYLLAPKRWSDIYLALVLALSAIVVLFTVSTQISSLQIQLAFDAGLPQGFRAIVKELPMTARIPTMILNITGAGFLIGGSLFSHVRDWSRTYNIPLFFGWLLPSLGGASLGFFNNVDVFFELKLAGTILLFLGFVLSIRYPSKFRIVYAQPRTQAHDEAHVSKSHHMLTFAILLTKERGDLAPDVRVKAAELFLEHVETAEPLPHAWRHRDMR